ncbi:hypothetical protein L3Q82_003341 [Scortum barcoo]|uniref:Uncharacterized protein n=1 Tax=Scortum barcoo TaxID=214431 RepID=A0ACB8VQR4_9TELE|nr:hypothetical protein L3Q82_003341 [Scortum barcoo]
MSHREEALGEDPGHAGETMSLSWPGNARGPPEELEEVSGGKLSLIIGVSRRLCEDVPVSHQELWGCLVGGKPVKS